MALSIVFTIFSPKSWVLRQWYAFRDHLEVTEWTDVLAVHGAMKITNQLAAAAAAKLRELNVKHCSAWQFLTMILRNICVWTCQSKTSFNSSAWSYRKHNSGYSTVLLTWKSVMCPAKFNGAFEHQQVITFPTEDSFIHDHCRWEQASGIAASQSKCFWTKQRGI